MKLKDIIPYLSFMTSMKGPIILYGHITFINTTIVEYSRNYLKDEPIFLGVMNSFTLLAI
jgi:hypothetical protein